MKTTMIITIVVSIVVTAAWLFWSTTSARGEDDAYCFRKAAAYYGVSSTLLYAISRVESNNDPMAVNRNAGGSLDVGHMQINSCWADKLGDGGWQALHDPCYNTHVGAWVLSQCVQRYGNTWDAVACYNTGKSPDELKGKRRRQALNYIGKVSRELDALKQHRASRGH